MKMIMLGLILLVTCVNAANANYKCVITDYTDAAKDKKTEQFERQSYAGKEFRVDRVSGRMIGRLKNSYATLPTVIESGGKENSFIVVTTMRRSEGDGAGANVHVLIVSEYVDSTKKPFTYLWNSEVFTGSCINF